LAIKANEAENKIAKLGTADGIIFVDDKENEDTALLMQAKSLQLQKLQLLLKAAKTASTQAHTTWMCMIAKN